MASGFETLPVRELASQEFSIQPVETRRQFIEPVEAVKVPLDALEGLCHVQEIALAPFEKDSGCLFRGQPGLGETLLKVRLGQSRRDEPPQVFGDVIGMLRAVAVDSQHPCPGEAL